jgi:hypothetical protein
LLARRLFEQYLFDQHFAHHGWSGFISALEDNPHTLLDRKKITFKELVAFELLMELDVLTHSLGNRWEPLANKVSEPPVDLLADVPKTDLAEVIQLWQEAFEWSYYDSVLKGILLASPNFSKGEALDPANSEDISKIAEWETPPSGGRGASLQAIFCIDEREDSIRRHVEAVDKKAETFGAPGFFGVEFYFQQQGSKFYDKLCPAPVMPKYLIKESGANTIRKEELIYTKYTHGIISGVFPEHWFWLLGFCKKDANAFSPQDEPGHF